jgi:hypothetical protein
MAGRPMVKKILAGKRKTTDLAVDWTVNQTTLELVGTAGVA